MDFRILGSMEILDGSRRVELPAGRGRSLLALLTLHAGEPIAAERLIDELWGEEAPTTAATVVHGLVSRLRKALEPERVKGSRPQVLETAGSAYCLAIDHDSVDANRFKRLLEEARASSPAGRTAKLSEAIELWRGPALADFVYEPFAQRAITALEELKMEAIEERFDAELTLGQDSELVPALLELIAEHPFRERLRAFLMLALYRSGRQTGALDVYRELRTLLRQEMGVEPGKAVRELEAAILRQDPTLDFRHQPRGSLGSQRAPLSWLPRERRTVTVAALDVAPPVEVGLDTEAAARISARTSRVALEVLERHGARVERSLSDDLIAFFGFPAAHEDDALRAIRALLDARAVVHALGEEGSTRAGVPRGWRAGVESGEIIVAGPGAGLRDAVTGPLVSAAARFQHAASDGEILIGPAAYRLLRGAVILKPLDSVDGTGRRAWRVLEVVRRAPAIPRAMDAPLIGRQDELTQLRSAFRRAARSGVVARTTIIGEAGIGKSRLANEVIASIGDDAHAVTIQCRPPGELPGFFPVRQAVIEAAGLHGWRGLHTLLERADQGRAVEDIGAAIGLRCPPATADQLFGALGRLLEWLARERPMIVVIDDLHWADRAFLDVVERLERELAGPVFLLCLARPNLQEWTVASAADVVRLQPLLPSELESLVINRGRPVARESLRKVVNISQGNPLFAEQLLAAIDDFDLDTIPPTLVGLLSMRLDVLGPGERDLLRCASVAGVDFDLRLVSALLPEEARPFVERHLATLVRKRFIEAVASRQFRFAHALIWMAAYQSITHEDRARLHEVLADRLDREGADPEIDLTSGYHLRQTVEHQTHT